MNNTKNSPIVAGFLLGVLSLIVAFSFLSIPAEADAAAYGYVDTAGFIRSVNADNWMNAIAIAPGISLHSGVLLLRSTADFNLVGMHINNL